MENATLVFLKRIRLVKTGEMQLYIKRWEELNIEDKLSLEKDIVPKNDYIDRLCDLEERRPKPDTQAALTNEAIILLRQLKESMAKDESKDYQLRKVGHIEELLVGLKKRL